MVADREPERGRYVAIDESTTPRQLVWRTMWGVNKYTVPAMVLVILHFVGEALVPVLMGLAIDRAVGEHDLAQLSWWVLALAVDFAMLSLTWRFGDRLAMYAKEVLEHQFRMRVTDRMLDPRGMAGPARLPGTALSIATSDVMRLSMAVLLAVFPVGEMLAVGVAGVIFLWVSWPLGIAVLVGAPLLLWLVDRLGGPLRARSEREQELAGDAAGTAADLVAGLRVLKGIGAERIAADRYRRVSRRARDGAIRATTAESVYIGILQMASSLFVVAVGIAAGVMAVQGHLTVGELITVVGLTQFIMGPLNGIGKNVGAVWNGAIPSGSRVLSVLQAGPTVQSGGATDIGSGHPTIRIRGLRAGTAHDLDLDIPGAGVTAVVTDQAIASVLCEVLAREERPAHGQVSVGQVDLFDLDHHAARQTVRVVPHTPHLFEGSVIDNIAVDGHPIGSDRVTRAITAAMCDDVAESLPDGLNSPVGEGGRTLSGGQRQRVGLARALVPRSSVLVLSDPTTAVDSVTEAEIARRLRVARGDGATVLFTTSPALIAIADEVITIADNVVRRRTPNSQEVGR